MKVLAALLLVCAACGGDDIELYPINPGGGGPSTGTGTRSDASEGDGDSGVQITARVCLISDARAPTTCATTGAEGLTVMLGTRTATTMADGTFTISVVTGTTNVWRVSGTGIVPSAMTVAAPNLIPALTQDIYTTMITDSSATVPADTGSIIAQLTTNNNPAIGATATVSTASGVFYDGGTATMWQQGSTGNSGVVWAAGVTPGNATMTVTSALQTTTQITNVPVFGNTITYVFADVP